MIDLILRMPLENFGNYIPGIPFDIPLLKKNDGLYLEKKAPAYVGCK
jgi:hypothetical protein